MNPNQQSNSDFQPARGSDEDGLVRVGKKEMKQRISSRQDFVMVFGLECCLTSELLPAAQEVHHLALHRASVQRGETADQAEPVKINIIHQ